ncbi:hypothetical protein Nepgr_001693 [Nepenthes gracilis]|uniref:Smr domain-containing protein n=1 Tax=Nepenthes gracilis TaxID=150966 RepID=A0AAD3RX71_NEPGR|nr:hypothetical protein Nepgr_001693 [Nepenthes gracilis]
MSWRRPKTSGWAAFDLQHRQKQIIEPQLHNDPFPSLQGTLASVEPCKTFPTNSNGSVESFSSVILPSANFPSAMENKNSSVSSEFGYSSGLFCDKFSQENKVDLIFTRLKQTNSWADDCLIEDVLAAVENDFEKASASLGAMVSVKNMEESKDSHDAVLNCSSKEFSHDNKILQAEKYAPMEDITGQAEFSSVLEVCFSDGKKKLVKGDEFLGNLEVNFMLGQSTDIPVEPEWEEDDIYLSHRKDAVKMIRAASRHSKAATNSFLRGDHVSARQFSLKAREEWAVAERLNAKAAREIMSIRNGKNGMWKLDLHSLHAAEAVQALQVRLQMIENRVSSSSSVGPNSDSMGEESAHTFSRDACSGIEDSEEQSVVPRQRQISLEIITGRGNHSYGEAAIPAAVRSFLTENGYWFEEAWPGAIMVRPKFRNGPIRVTPEL